MSDATTGAERLWNRRSWPVRIYRLGSEPGDDLSDTTTAEERLAMMWPLCPRGLDTRRPSRARLPPPPEPGGTSALAAGRRRRVGTVNEDFRDLLAAVGVSQADLARADQVVQIGLPPRRIDLLTSLTGIGFEEAWPERAIHRVADVDVPFLGRAALVRNKRATGRAKDLADLAALGERGR